jgi:Ni/Co efflux regulator RcnB
MRKIHLAVAALALAIAAAPVAKLQAAGLVSPDARPQVEGLMQVVKAKKAKKAKRSPGRVARSRGPGHCGENMYWKKGKCVDARNKA